MRFAEKTGIMIRYCGYRAAVFEILLLPRGEAIAKKLPERYVEILKKELARRPRETEKKLLEKSYQDFLTATDHMSENEREKS